MCHVQLNASQSRHAGSACTVLPSCDLNHSDDDRHACCGRCLCVVGCRAQPDSGDKMADQTDKVSPRGNTRLRLLAVPRRDTDVQPETFTTASLQATRLWCCALRHAALLVTLPPLLPLPRCCCCCTPSLSVQTAGQVASEEASQQEDRAPLQGEPHRP